MSVIIFHNPRCSKSRQALEILKNRDIEPEIVEYLKDGPSEEDIKIILELLGVSIKDILRKKDAIYKEAGFDNDDLSDDQLIKLASDNPSVIERPIVINGDKAAIGRPPESILEIL